MSLPPEDPNTGRVERRNLHRRGPRSHQLDNSLAHFRGRFVGEGDRHDLVRRHLAVADHVRNSASEDTGLPRACARHNEEWAAFMEHRVTLTIVQIVE
jgi:hypothetical protein